MINLRPKANNNQIFSSNSGYMISNQLREENKSNACLNISDIYDRRERIRDI